MYSEIPSAEFAAVFDIDPARAAAIGRKYNVKTAGSIWEFGDLVDAASVATPTTSHYDVARALLQSGKHLLIEKPITESTRQASELATMNGECTVQAGPTGDVGDMRITSVIVNNRAVADEAMQWQYGPWSVRRYINDWAADVHLKKFEISDGRVILETNGSNEPR